MSDCYDWNTEKCIKNGDHAPARGPACSNFNPRRAEDRSFSSTRAAYLASVADERERSDAERLVIEWCNANPKLRWHRARR